MSRAHTRLIGLFDPTPTPALLLTSLIDIVAVLCLFLLTRLYASLSPPNQVSDVVMPRLAGAVLAEAPLHVVVSRTSIRIDDEVILHLVDGAVPATALAPHGIIAPLLGALFRATQSSLVQATPQLQRFYAPRRLLLHIGRHAPFSLLEMAGKTAGAAGFVDMDVASLPQEF